MAKTTKSTPKNMTTVKILLIGLIAGALFYTLSTYMPPKLTIENDPVDFGLVFPNQPLSTTFTLQNDGFKPLEIEITKTSCACTKATLETNTLGFHQSTQLTSVLNAPNDQGPFSFTIALATNDSIHKRVLHLTGQVHTLVNPNPKTLNFGVIRPNELPLTRTVMLKKVTTATNEKDISITPQNTDNNISYTMTPQDDLTTLLEVTIKPGIPNGTIKKDIHLNVSGLDNEYIVTIPRLYRLID